MMLAHHAKCAALQRCRFYGRLSRLCGAFALIAGTLCFSQGVRADEVELARLRAEVAALRAELAECKQSGGTHGGDAALLGLIRKLGAQQGAAADLATGLGTGPLILPEALLRSVVPNEFIVLLAADAPRPGTAADVAALYGVPEGQVLHIYDQALAGFAVRLSEAGRVDLQARTGVAGIARNGRVFSTGTVVSPSVVAPHASVHKAASHGAPIEVYLFDTGIRRAHRDLQGRVRETGFSFFDNGIAGEDCSGHGTHVAARVAGNHLGVSRAAQLTSVKVIDRFGTGDVATVIAGIDWVMAQKTGSKLVNMSLTRMVTEDPNPLDMAVGALIDSGAVVVVAAGNSAADVQDFTPARVVDAITVGSATGAMLSDFSNAGSGVDIYAPGEAVVSASIRDICGVQEMSGTSMAAPYVTGLIAELLATGTPTHRLVGALRQSAKRYDTGAFAGETERYVLSAKPDTAIALCGDRLQD